MVFCAAVLSAGVRLVSQYVYVSITTLRKGFKKKKKKEIFDY